MYLPSKILLRSIPCFRHPELQHSKKNFFLILSNRLMMTVIKFCWDYFFIAFLELITLEATSKGQLCNHQHNKFLFCNIILIFHTGKLLLSCWSQTISNFWNIPIRTEYILKNTIWMNVWSWFTNVGSYIHIGSRCIQLVILNFILQHTLNWGSDPQGPWIQVHWDLILHWWIYGSKFAKIGSCMHWS